MPERALSLDLKLNDAEAKALIQGIPQEIERRQKSTMTRALQLLKVEAQHRIRSPHGRARRGISYQVRGGAAEALSGLLRSRSVPAIFSQRTREPNKAMPPVRKIARWLRRIGQERTPASAFLVARAIARKGTKGHPVMEDTMHVKRWQVLALVDEMVKRALRRR